MKRRKLTLSDKVTILCRQALCMLCGELLGPEIEWDHTAPLAMGGMDDPVNIRAVHPSCHAKKTRGTPATTAGSDIGNIAKAKRLRKKMADFWERMTERMNTPVEITIRTKTTKPKRKIQSRGFAKGHRPLRGRVTVLCKECGVYPADYYNGKYHPCPGCAAYKEHQA